MDGGFFFLLNLAPRWIFRWGGWFLDCSSHPYLPSFPFPGPNKASSTQMLMLPRGGPDSNIGALMLWTVERSGADGGFSFLTLLRPTRDFRVFFFFALSLDISSHPYLPLSPPLQSPIFSVVSFPPPIYSKNPFRPRNENTKRANSFPTPGVFFFFFQTSQPTPPLSPTPTSSPR